MTGRSNLTSWIAAAVLVGSMAVLLLKNLQLRERLRIANMTAVALQAGAFREAEMLQSEGEPPVSASPTRLPGVSEAAPRKGGEIREGRGCRACGEREPFGRTASTVKYAVTPPADRRDFASIPALTLLGLKYRYLRSESDRELTLYVFFSPTDCPACLREAATWERLFRDGGSLRLSVVGVVDRCSPEEVKSLCRQLGITFPVYVDEHSLLRKFFEIPETPEKILTDSQGKAVLTSPGDQTAESQTAFEREVRERCNIR